MSSITLARIRGTLKFRLYDISDANAGKQFKRKPFYVKLVFRDATLETWRFTTQKQAHEFVAQQMKWLEV